MNHKNANDIEQELLRRGVEKRLAHALVSPETETDRALAQVVLDRLYPGKPLEAAERREGAA